jgi:hypothetical protein
LVATFADVRDRLVAGDSGFEHLGRNLVRLLDHSGVIGGPIAEQAATLQRHLLRLSVSQLLLYDGTLHVRGVRHVDSSRSLSLGEHVDDELGDFVVMRIDSHGGFTTYHAVRSAAWDKALQAFQSDPRSAREDAMAHVSEYLPSTGARGQPEPAADPRFGATFKSEDRDEDGETIGSLIVVDSESGDVVWEASGWLRLSEARTLAETKGWQFYADGC